VAESGRGNRWRWPFVAAVIAILGIAGVVRAIPVEAGLPYTTYVDEGHYLHPTAHMVAGTTWKVGRFLHPYQHPTLLYDLTAVATEGGRITGVQHVQSQAETTSLSLNYDLIEPESMILAGRIIDIVLSVGTVLLTVLLAWKLVGRTAALAAGVFCALLPSLVTRSPIVIVDTPAAFFVALTLLLLAHSTTSRRASLLVALAGVSAGLAFTSKYPSGAVFVAVVVLVARRQDIARNVKRRWLEVAALGGAAAALVTMPGLVLAPVQVATDIVSEAKVYVHKTSATNYAQDMVNRHEVGWSIAVLGAIGLFLLWRRTAAHDLTIAWLAFAVPSAAYLGVQNFQPFRNLLPLLPYLTIAAAAALVDAARLVGRLTSLPRLAQDAAVIALAAVVGLYLFRGGVQPWLRQNEHVVDSRTMAVDWLETHAQPGSRILVAEQLSILPDQLEQVAGHIKVAPVTEHLTPAQLGAYDYVITSDYEPQATVWPVAAADQRVARYGTTRSPRQLNGFRVNNQLVLIFHRKGHQTVH
jgi:hypothetical protein